MATEQSHLDCIRNFFQERKILTLASLKEMVGTTSTMTVYRRLKNLSYLTSYSHLGKQVLYPARYPRVQRLGFVVLPSSVLQPVRQSGADHQASGGWFADGL